ncbi:helix-hairpin-helix domain-containing protein [Streptomyces sp. 549]|uniref:DNA polymerase Y family protein n=1 Tax=Streptomyces sp. 549 TaxID=3049076 RepID=UPI0024C26818|nr:helix-hairpin-helix domain-containing protein [Streptomyces sp. 549]MDK1475671.1 helix-hairpin-helix domain-containing protein [Streptomyces sp. 549]
MTPAGPGEGVPGGLDGPGGQGVPGGLGVQNAAGVRGRVQEGVQEGVPGGQGGPVHVLYVHFGPGAAGERYPELLELLADLTPVVQALPPDAALADVRGALRYFDRTAAELAEMLRVRSLARHGVDCTVGVAGNPLLARMAAQAGPPGRVTEVAADPSTVAAFLRDRPVAALHGVGPKTARALCDYGLDTIGRVAAAPPATLQRILGASTARRVRQSAEGADPGSVVPSAPARSTAAEHRFAHQELDADRRRRALLTLADELGFRMRDEGQVARALTLTVRYADRSTTTRTRALPEPTSHTPALTTAAYALHDSLGLQRARVRGLSLRAEDLTAAALAARQLSLDPGEEKARRAEAAADRARSRFGAAAAHPAAVLGDAA